MEFTTNNETGPKFVAQIAIGNMLDKNSGFGDQGMLDRSTPFRSGDFGWYAQRFYVDFDTTLGDVGLNSKVGRIGYKVNRMMFQRPDTTPYFRNERWDDGYWTFDGAILGVRLNSSKLTLFGGDSGPRFATNNVELQSMVSGRQFALLDPIGNRVPGLKSDQVFGAHLWLPLGDWGHVNLVHLWNRGKQIDHGFKENIERANESHVYGGDLSYSLGGDFSIETGYSKNDLLRGGKRILGQQNQAWNVNLKIGRSTNPSFLSLGYRSIDPLYGAPGAWGRAGAYWNPVDLEGLVLEGGLALNSRSRILLNGSLLKGRGTSKSVLGNRDQLQSATVGVEYSFGPVSKVYTNFEANRWEFQSGSKPFQNWFTVGINHMFGERLSFRLFWQSSDAHADGDERFRAFGQERARGGLIGSQLTFRY